MTQESPWKYFKDEKPEMGKKIWVVFKGLSKPILLEEMTERDCQANTIELWAYAEPPPLPKPEPKCPWCGEMAVTGKFSTGTPSTFYGRCIKSECLASGPVRTSEQEALDAFCNAEVKK